MKEWMVDDMKEEAVRKHLKSLIQELDNLDGEDYFGTEGWRHRFGWED